MMGTFLREEFTRNPLRRIAALVAWPVLAAFRRRVDQRRYNGASLLGLQRHRDQEPRLGRRLAFGQALERAADEVQQRRACERITERHGSRQPRAHWPQAAS